jgi:hypothetical protein
MGGSTSSTCCVDRQGKDLCPQYCIVTEEKTLMQLKTQRVRNNADGSVIIEPETLNSKSISPADRNRSSGRIPTTPNAFIPQYNPVSFENMREKKDQEIAHLPEFTTRNQVWAQDHAPLKGWTRDDQRVILSVLEQYPSSQRHQDYLKYLFIRIHRALPHKSLADIGQCYQYIERQRIASSGLKNNASVRG